MSQPSEHPGEGNVSRRTVLAGAAAGLGWAALAEAEADARSDPGIRSAAGLLRKPFKMNELWYAVRQALAETTDA